MFVVRIEEAKQKKILEEETGLGQDKRSGYDAWEQQCHAKCEPFGCYKSATNTIRGTRKHFQYSCVNVTALRIVERTRD